MASDEPLQEIRVEGSETQVQVDAGNILQPMQKYRFAVLAVGSGNLTGEWITISASIGEILSLSLILVACSIVRCRLALQIPRVSKEQTKISGRYLWILFQRSQSRVWYGIPCPHHMWA